MIDENMKYILDWSNDKPLLFKAAAESELAKFFYGKSNETSLSTIFLTRDLFY